MIILSDEWWNTIKPLAQTGDMASVTLHKEYEPKVPGFTNKNATNEQLLSLIKTKLKLNHPLGVFAFNSVFSIEPHNDSLWITKTSPLDNEALLYIHTGEGLIFNYFLNDCPYQTNLGDRQFIKFSLKDTHSVSNPEAKLFQALLLVFRK